MSGLSDECGQLLLQLARGAIDHALGGEACLIPDEGWLFQPGAAFVTLRQDDALRGCIGSLAADRALGEDVQQNAVSAALRDPRFAPLRRNELDLTRLEVTVLSALEPLEAASQDDCLRQLRPGVDGLVISWGSLRATFIPQMWEQLPEPAEFLKYLKRKAGMPQDFWHPSIRLQRYTAQKWKEEGFGG